MNKRRTLALGDETIVAIITPPGQSGVAGIRLAGSQSDTILATHFRSSSNDAPNVEWQPFLMRHGFIVDSDGQTIDEVLAVVMPAGRSFTGEQQAEIFCHGGYGVVRKILAVLLSAGARAARPGEFTRLAFLNGRIDLTRAEAVAGIIAANTETSIAAAAEHISGAYAEHVGGIREQVVGVLAEMEAALDYPEEDLTTESVAALGSQVKQISRDINDLAASYKRGRIVREGFKCAIAGRPNAGKSSLFNLLVERERALVAPSPGTTRDYLEEWIELGGVAVQLIDTAGFREGAEEVEEAGLQKAMEQMSAADLVLWLADLSQPEFEKQVCDDLKVHNIRSKILVGNKLDLIQVGHRGESQPPGLDVEISCLTGQGLDSLRSLLIEQISSVQPDLTDGHIVTSGRQAQKLAEAESFLAESTNRLDDGSGLELAAFELRQAINAIDEIIGRVYSEEVLERIFAKFCVGK